MGTLWWTLRGPHYNIHFSVDGSASCAVNTSSSSVVANSVQNLAILPNREMLMFARFNHHWMMTTAMHKKKYQDQHTRPTYVADLILTKQLRIRRQANARAPNLNWLLQNKNVAQRRTSCWMDCRRRGNELPHDILWEIFVAVNSDILWVLVFVNGLVVFVWESIWEIPCISVYYMKMAFGKHFCLP